MQVDLSHEEFQNAVPILKQIEDSGYHAYFVGGSVRDAILGLPIHDVDIATSAYPEEIKSIFQHTIDTGIKHGTVMVRDHGLGYEVTTFRTESGYQDFRRPDHVTFVRNLEEDLLRRDFTVNALAVTADGELIDLFGGIDDLNAQLLRAVGNPNERFHEDALRMMRAVRFESQLGFTIEPQTLAAIAANAPLLAKISVERIASEFDGLMLGANRAGGLRSFVRTELYRYVPGMVDAESAMTRLEALPPTRLTDSAVAWTLVVDAIEAPATPFLKKWKQSNQLIQTVGGALALLKADRVGDFELYLAGETAVAVAAQAYELTQGGSSDWMQRYRDLSVHGTKELAVSGRDLLERQIASGPALGQLLRKLEQAVVEGRLPNDKTALLAAAREGVK